VGRGFNRDLKTRRAALATRGAFPASLRFRSLAGRRFSSGIMAIHQLGRIPIGLVQTEPCAELPPKLGSAY